MKGGSMKPFWKKQIPPQEVTPSFLQEKTLASDIQRTVAELNLLLFKAASTSLSASVNASKRIPPAGEATPAHYIVDVCATIEL